MAEQPLPELLDDGTKPPPWWSNRVARYPEDVPRRYRGVAGVFARAGEVPKWVLEACSLSRGGRSLLLQLWLEWCAEAGGDAPRRAHLLATIARTMPRSEALAMVQHTVNAG